MATKGNDGKRAGGGATAATTGATGTTATGRRFNNGFDTTTAAGDDGGGGGGGSSSALVGKINALEKDLERRQESYVARERAYKTRIEELEEELKFQRQEKTGWMKSDTKMVKLKSMQGQIVKNVELVQDRTSRVLQEQERDLLRAFRARLFDVQTELEKEKSKKEDGAGAWIERSRKLEAEVEWAKEVADRLERVNQTLMTDNARLKSQFASQEEDRNFLITQLVSVKKDNAQLRAELATAEADTVALQVQAKKLEDEVNANMATRHGSKLSGGGGGGDGSGAMPNDERYKEINARLRRLLADERRALQHVRANYAQELRSRTEMELLLRQCVDDVRKEIALKMVATTAAAAAASTGPRTGTRGASRGGEGVPGRAAAGGVPVSAFVQADRERTLELLLSQERVISLIYAKTFPVGPSSSSAGKRASSSSLDAGAGVDSGAADVAVLEALAGGGVATVDHSGPFRGDFFDDTDPDDLPVSQGGGGPLVAAALRPDDGKLPAL